MRQLVKGTFRTAEALLVICLAAMVVMVFGNVVLRYAFSTGIVFSEEMSRYLFVWMTFLGAVVAMRDHLHIGMDGLIRRLPRNGQLACFVISSLLMLGCCWLLLVGGWKQMFLNIDVKAQVSGIPMAAVYSSLVVAALGLGAIILMQLYRALTGGPVGQAPADLQSID